MKKYRLNGSLASLKSTNNRLLCKSKQHDIPPLSTKSYVFSARKVRVKQQQVKSVIHEVEGLMAAELGRTPCAKKTTAFRRSSK